MKISFSPRRARPEPTSASGCGVEAIKSTLLNAGYDIPMIDPVPTAVAMAAALSMLGLSQSRISYPAFERDKSFTGFNEFVGIERWPEFNAIYAELMGESRPARAVVPAPALHYDWLIEVDVCNGASGNSKVNISEIVRSQLFTTILFSLRNIDKKWSANSISQPRG